MSLLTELFGEEILHANIEEVKEKIKNLPDTTREKKSYLIKDWAAATTTPLTVDDFKDIEG